MNKKEEIAEQSRLMSMILGFAEKEQGKESHLYQNAAGYASTALLEDAREHSIFFVLGNGARDT